MAWKEVCQFEELKNQAWLSIELEGRPLILFSVQDKAVCYLDRCSHQDVRLSDFGKRENDHILCFAHGAVFSLVDGSVMYPPACEALTSFDCRVQDGVVEVNLGETPS